MKKQIDKDMLPEYDFSKGIRGKYVSRLAKGCNIAVLDEDVQKIFPDSAAVNAALRALGQAVDVVTTSHALSSRTKKAPVKTVRAG